MERECHTGRFCWLAHPTPIPSPGALIRVFLHTKTPPQSYLRLAHARSLPSTPPSRCFLRVFLIKDRWPVGQHFPCSSPFFLVSLANREASVQVNWLHRQAAGSIIPRPSLPNHSRSSLSCVTYLHSFSGLPVTRLYYMGPVGCPHT